MRENARPCEAMSEFRARHSSLCRTSILSSSAEKNVACEKICGVLAAQSKLNN